MLTDNDDSSNEVLYDDDDNQQCGQKLQTIADDNDSSHRTKGAFSSWLRLWATPPAGWKRIRNRRIPATEMEQKVLYPMLALTALGSFAHQFYFDISVAECLMTATRNFVSFFAAYFLTFPIARLLLKREAAYRIETAFGHCYVAALTATLAFTYFLYQCLPTLEELVKFAPAYTVYLSFKGLATLNVSQKYRISTWIILTALIFLLPVLIYELLGLVLPTNP